MYFVQTKMPYLVDNPRLLTIAWLTFLERKFAQLHASHIASHISFALDVSEKINVAVL